MGLLKRLAPVLLLLAAPAFAAELSSVRAVVDPRIELLGVVQYLAGLRGETARPLTDDFPDLEKRFGAFREHPAVKDYAAAVARRGGRDSLGMALMYLTDLPALQWTANKAYAGPFINDAGGPEAMERFLADLRDFSERSRFLDYFAEHRAAFDAYEKTARAEIGTRDYAKLLTDSFGSQPAFRFTLVIPAIYKPDFCCYMIPYPYNGPTSPARLPVSGRYEIISMLYRIEGGKKLRFGLDDATGCGALNEGIYLFIEPGFVEHGAEIEAQSRLFEEFKGGCFESWRHCSAHLIATALSSRLEQREFGRETKWSPDLKGRVEKALAERLAEFDGDRKRYPRLADFFPRLADVFAEFNAKLPPPAAPAAETKTGFRPEILLDSRVELAAALHILASSKEALPGFRDDGGPYARVLLEGLRDKTDHPAVGAYARMARRPAPGAQHFMTPLRVLVLCLDDELRMRAGPAECGSSSLAHAAASFARETGFVRRLPELVRLTAPAVDALKRQRDTADLTSLYEEYSGVKVKTQRVAPSPLLETGMAWNGIERPSTGTYWIVTVISPVSLSAGGPVFDWVPVMRDVWHENSHGILDPAEEPYDARIDAASGLFTGQAASDCYGSWRQCVREHLAQGTALRIIEWSRKTGKLATTADPVVSPRLPWEPLIAARLAEYEADRKRYPDLTSFVPRLISVFTEEAAKRGLKPGPAAAASAAPNRSDPELERGMALFAAGKPAEAAAVFEAVVKRSSGPATNYMSLSVALQAAGRSAEAAAALDRAVDSARSDPMASPEILPDALESRSALRLAKGEKAGARGDLEEALTVAPENWERRADVERRLSDLR